MTYEELLLKLMASDWQRVERDDRLLDIFPEEDREKGVELWEQQHGIDTLILRVRLPFSEDGLKLYTIAGAQLQHLLLQNTESNLADFEETETGSNVTRQL